MPDADALGDLWVAVTRAGGAVGFTPAHPEQDIRAATVQAVAAVTSGGQHMVGLWQGSGSGHGSALVGAVFLVPQEGHLLRHRATVVRLMVHPDLQGHGWGSRLLGGAVQRARTLGLEQLDLFARSGEGLADFYTRQGWSEVGRWRSSLRVAPGDVRDDLWFARDV